MPELLGTALAIAGFQPSGLWVNSIALNEYRSYLRRHGQERQLESYDAPPLKPTALLRRLIEQLLQGLLRARAAIRPLLASGS